MKVAHAFLFRSVPFGVFLARMLAVAVIAALVDVPAAAERKVDTEKREDGIDYTKPFLYDGIYPLDPCGLQNLRSREDYEQALKCVRRVLKSGKHNPAERAMLLRFAAWFEVELGDFERAIIDTEAALASGALTRAEKAEAYYFLGRLYLGIEPPDYDKAIENLRKYIETADDPDPDAYFYLGQALALQGKYRDALPYARKAIELTKPPKENHYRLLLFCYSELQDYRHVVSTVERMLKLFPVRDEYLSQLAWAYQELGRERDAFLVQAFRYELGFLDSESELVGIADLYLLYEYPHRAAQILEKEMKAGRVRRTERNLEKLGNMYYLAREYDKAQHYLLEAAKLSNKGELDFRIGQVYFEDENWKMAERHFRIALRKGGLEEPCQAHVMLGHTLHEQGKDEAAIREFELAEESEACRKEASQWADYLRPFDNWVPETEGMHKFMVKVLEHLKNSTAAIGDNETTLAVAEEGLESAKAALETESDEVRRLKLAEYERARASALRRLNAGALEEARKDRAEAEEILAQAPKDLTGTERKVLKELDRTSKRRVEALEKAQALLKQAEEIAAKARARAKGRQARPADSQ